VRDPGERLLDMLEAIERIDRYAEKGREAFEKDELIQNWFVHHLQIVGEAAAKLGRRFHEDHPELPWAQIVGMRNVLVHDYFGVDLEEVWSAVERDLPSIKQSLLTLIDELNVNDG